MRDVAASPVGLADARAYAEGDRIVYGPEMIEPASEAIVAPHRPRFAGRVAAFVRRLGPAGPLSVAVVVLPVIGGTVLLGSLKDLAPWCRDNARGVAPFVVTVAGTLLCGCSLLPTYAITILAAWAFGFEVGLPVAFLAHAVAGIVGFGLAHALMGNRLPLLFDVDPRLVAVRESLVGQGQLRAGAIITLIRLAPVAPFGMTNVLAASARCPFAAFAIGSGLGILPQTVLLVYAASRMRQLSFEQEPWMLAVGIASTLIVITILTKIARHALGRVTGVR